MHVIPKPLIIEGYDLLIKDKFRVLIKGGSHLGLFMDQA